MADRVTKKLKAEISEALYAFLFREKEAHIGQYGYLNGGGALFDAFIRNNPEYRPFWKEKEVLEQEGSAIASKISDTEHVIVVGQGSAFMDKEWNIVKNLPDVKKVTLIDLSATFNEQAKAVLQENLEAMASYSEDDYIDIETLTGRYQDLDKKQVEKLKSGYEKTAVMCFGSLITNIEEKPNGSYPEKETRDMLKALFRLAANDGYAVIGYDTNDEISVLRQTYGSEDLKEFYLNLLHYMFKHTDDIRIEDADGNELDKNDRDIINRIFEFDLPVGEFDVDIRNFPHRVKTKETFKVFAPSDDKDEQWRSSDIEGGSTFNAMNVYKPRPTRVKTISKDVGDAANHYSVTPTPGYQHEGIQLDLYKLTPKVA